MLEVYGPSVFTVGMRDWPRHRRAVAAPFNEAGMEFVWGEALHQAEYSFPLPHPEVLGQMRRNYILTLRFRSALLGHWTSSSDNNTGIPALEEDMQTVSLNVLASAAFGKQQDFEDVEARQSSNPGTLSYRGCLFIVHQYCILLMLIPYRLLLGCMIPKTLAKVGRSAASLKEHMVNAIEEEIQAIDLGEPESGGLITRLVRALDETNENTKTGVVGGNATSRKGALSREEIMGNLFVINFAGYDTTANSLTFVMMLLAAHPDVQDWLGEEIISVTQGKPVAMWTYSLFPKLKRCQAVLLETLRVYGPITGLPKIASGKVQHLHVGDRKFYIPPGMETILLPLSVQTDPRYWEDCLRWKPSRWIEHFTEAGSEVGASTGFREELFIPRKGSYFPWSNGMMFCIGQKFSRVEAVAMLAVIFQKSRLRPKTKPGETLEQARLRALDCVEDVNYQMLLKMNNSSQVRLERIAC